MHLVMCAHGKIARIYSGLLKTDLNKQKRNFNQIGIRRDRPLPPLECCFQECFF